MFWLKIVHIMNPMMEFTFKFRALKSRFLKNMHQINIYTHFKKYKILFSGLYLLTSDENSIIVTSLKRLE